MDDEELNILIYQLEDGVAKVNVSLEDNTVWLSQKAMGVLYQRNINTINEHIKSIYSEKELDENSTIRKNRIVQTEGTRTVKREISYYNLEMILAVGYRVKSRQGTQFRKWATATLNEYLQKGFVMNDEELKEGKKLGKDYFDELLERIRDIRSSEKMFYRKITDIFVLSVDYDRNSEEANSFFSTIQNKLHFAVHGNTAGELIRKRADASKDNMGLTTWKSKRVRKSDITVGKNYLTEKELKGLNKIVTMYIDYAEDQAERNSFIYMKQWIEKTDKFLAFNDRELLIGNGGIRKKEADEFAKEEYETYKKKRIAQDTNKKNDFDVFLEETKKIIN